MKKNDLIKFLKGIDGNPDIVTWSEKDQELVSINKEFIFEEEELVKKSVEHFLAGLIYDHYQDTGVFKISDEDYKSIVEEAKKMHKKAKYRLETYYTGAKKKVVVMYSKDDR